MQGPILAWDRRTRMYIARNQISTYEMLGRLERHYARGAQDTTRRLDAELQRKEVQEACGRYAGLNNWSPCCTAAQLRQLARRAHAAYATQR